MKKKPENNNNKNNYIYIYYRVVTRIYSVRMNLLKNNFWSEKAKKF